MAGTNPAMIVRIAATLEEFKRNLKEGRNQIETTTAAMAKLSASFSGDKIIQHAHNVASAIQNVGGVTKLTAAEQARANTVIERALEKYRALGQQAPTALQNIADATKKADDTTKSWAQTIGTDFKARFATMVAGFISAQAIIAGVRMAWGLLTDFIVGSIDSYSRAEAAQKRLTTALQAQGTATPATIRQFEALAVQFQRTTIYSDDLITEMQALLVQVGGVLPSEMSKALGATTNLASGLGIDLRAATMMVSKAFEDNFGALKKAGVEIDIARAKAEGMTYVLGQIQAKFGGQAQADLETYAGQVAHLANEWDNLKEAVGRLLVQGLNLPEWLSRVSDGLSAVNAALITSEGKLLPLINAMTIFVAVVTRSKDAQLLAAAAFQKSNVPVASHNTLIAQAVVHHRNLAPAIAATTLSVDRSHLALFNYIGLLPALRSGYESWIQRGIEANGTLRAGIPLWYGTAAATRAVGAELDTGTFNLNAWILSLKQVPAEMERVSVATKGTADEAAASALAWVQWGIQVVHALDQATQSASKAKNALSGALAGAQAGSSFGARGIAIGAIAGLFVGLIRSEDKLAAARQAAADSIVQERAAFVELAGGIEALRAKADLAGISLDKLFQFQVDAAAFKAEIDRINAAFAAWQARIAGLNQAAGGLGSMTTGFAAPFTKPLADLDTLQKSLPGLKIALVDAFKAGDLKGIKDAQLALMNAQLEIKKTGNELKKMATNGQAEFDRLGTYAVATFAGILKETGSLSQAFAAVGPSLDTLISLQGSLGFTSSATVQALLDIRKVVNANQAVMQSVDGLNQVMAGLTAAGMVNQTLFTAFGQDATALFAKLQVGGATSSQALALMQPTLQTLWQQQKDFGFETDEATKALIDEAVKIGLVGDKHKPVSEKMLAALGLIKDAIDKLTLALTGPTGVTKSLGDLGGKTRVNQGEWTTWADHGVAQTIRIQRGLDAMQFPDMPGVPSSGGGVPSSATSSATTSSGGSSSSSSTMTMRGGPSIGTVHIHVSGVQSPAQAQQTAAVVADELVKLLDGNVGGRRTKTRKALRVA